MGRFVDRFLLKCGLCREPHIPLAIEGRYVGGKQITLLECPQCGDVWKAESVSGSMNRVRRANWRRERDRYGHTYGRLTERLQEYAGLYRV
jgi:hypothetical protein